MECLLVCRNKFQIFLLKRDQMSKAIDQVKDLTVGYMALGLHGSSVGTVKQQVHDGDTINVRAVGNFGVRLLGIDAPEISFTLPAKNASQV